MKGVLGRERRKLLKPETVAAQVDIMLKVVVSCMISVRSGGARPT